MTDAGAPLGVGVIGCGSVSNRYFRHLPVYDHVRVVGCADATHERAVAAAERYGIPRTCTVAEMLADPDVDLVVNLTPPQAHVEVMLAAIRAGKHVYSEKPLAVDRAGGARILREAAGAGVMAGCAPDTFLGAGIQTSRMVLDEGVIGEPIGASATFTSPGHEHWHPNPGFFYTRGGGPVLDMGPYYLTALVVLLGPIAGVTGLARRTQEARTSDLHPGVRFPVEVSTHVAGVLDFAAGPPATVTMSFDVWGTEAPRIEVYGASGTLSVPDPNNFGGPVRVKVGNGEWEEMPPRFDEGGRGIGVAEMASAIVEGRPSRIDASLAHHVLDAMQALQESSDQASPIKLASTCTRPDVRETGRMERQQ